MKNPLLKKIIIITGTHLTPAVELINQLKADKNSDWDIHYIGRRFNSSVDDTPSIESQIIPKLDVKFYPIDCGKYDRKWLPNTIKGIPQTIKGLFNAFNLVRKIKPNIVVSFGGYVSVPVVISSWFTKTPSITHEQTLTNSLTTKINSYFVSKVALSFNNPDQIKLLPSKKVVITGNLLRADIYKSESKHFKKLIDLKKHPSIIYITAGNQGSHIINTTIKSVLKDLKDFVVIHQTGQAEFPEYKSLSEKYKNYYPFEYINLSDIGWIFNNSKIIISRSGANTSQEIVSLNKNSILIPLPKSQQNEQELNAFWVKKQLPQNTIVISQETLTPELLLENINKFNKISSPSIKNINNSTNLNLLKLINETN